MDKYWRYAFVLWAFSIVTLGCETEHQDIKDPIFLTELETLTGLSFPTTANWIGYHLDRGMDYFFAAAVDIQEGELAIMLDGKDFTWSDTNRHVTNSSYDAPWFTPDSIMKFRSTESRYPNPHSVLRILYEDSEASGNGKTRVYIIWFELS